MAKKSKHSTRHEYATEKILKKKFKKLFLPMLVVPEFELMDHSLNIITKATITISKGYHAKDVLELDTNLTLIKEDHLLRIENTNIILPEGGFNATTRQLVLQGEDSVTTYESIFESILLDNPQGLTNTYHEIKYIVYDEEGHRHRLGVTVIDLTHQSLYRLTLLDEIISNDFLIEKIDEQNFQRHNDYPIKSFRVNFNGKK